MAPPFPKELNQFLPQKFPLFFGVFLKRTLFKPSRFLRINNPNGKLWEAFPQSFFKWPNSFPQRPSNQFFLVKPIPSLGFLPRTIKKIFGHNRLLKFGFKCSIWLWLAHPLQLLYYHVSR